MKKIDSNQQSGATCGSPQLQIFLDAGFSQASADAIAEIDVTMQRIRRSIQKREFVVEILKEVAPDLELSHLDAMSAIGNSKHEPSPDETEVTVGLVAERLELDPSRASRIVAELVEMGYARRVASQVDARRICIEATDKGWAFADEFRRRKWEIMSRGLEGWTEDEVLIFRTLLERFSQWGKRGLESLAQRAAAE